MKTTIRRTILASVCSLFACTLPAQTNLNFNNISATVESAIILSWNSTSNEVYAVDYATELIADGGTVWTTLYEDYPSHGTNTFIADAGNYDFTPSILHPKTDPMRFYRVRLVQANDSPTNPIVAITSITNGQSLSGDVTIQVVASSSEFLADVKLYIDGEEQWSSFNTSTNSGGTNLFLVNTCEWPNGTHTIFATAKSQSGLEGAPNGGVVTYGRSVSPYRNVSFDNLITRLDLSERFFEPELGQTQKVTASFAANVNWTLEIQNAANQDVRYVTGSGSSMSFDWDGTGTNGVTIPNGVYTYLLTVQTNGQSMLMSGGDSASEAYSLFSSNPTFAASKSESWFPTSAKEALAAGLTSYLVASPPMPPVVTKVDGKLKFVPWAEVYGEPEPVEMQVPQSAQDKFLALLSGGESESASAYSGPSTQSTRGPKRKPRVGVKGQVGTFGICYKTYGTNGFSGNAPLTGWPFPLQTRVAIDDRSPTALVVDYRVGNFKPMADKFSEVMTAAGWKQKFLKVDSQWGASDIKKPSLGGSSIFNTCNFGILMTHGSYANNNNQGNSSDAVKYTYNWLGGNDYVKLSDMDFGSAGTNGLRWMTIFACNILRQPNYASMNNQGKIPVNDNLHLLLGFNTTGYAAYNLGKYYANYLVYTNQTIINSLADSCADAYTENSRGITNIVRIGISGWDSCQGDTLTLYNDPDLNSLQYNERTVFIPQ